MGPIRTTNGPRQLSKQMVAKLRAGQASVMACMHRLRRQWPLQPALRLAV